MYLLDNKSSPSDRGRGWIWNCQIDNTNMYSISLHLSTNLTLEAQNPRRGTSIPTVSAGLTPSSFIIAVGFDMWHGCVSKYVLFLLLAFTPAVVCPPPHTLFHLVLEYSKLVNDSRQGGRGAQVWVLTMFEVSSHPGHCPLPLLLLRNADT